MKVFFKSLGSCGMRRTNAQAYREFLRANGHEVMASPEGSSVILIWTCAFRKDFRDNSISEVLRYLKEYQAEVIIAGCLPDIDAELLSEKFSGRVVNWRDDAKKMEEYFGAKGGRLAQFFRPLAEDRLCGDVDEFKKANPEKDATFADQFVKLFVAEGCRFECTYCAERLAFPPYRSFPEDGLVDACRSVVLSSGHTDVMLLADSLGDYGCDIETTLPNLMRRLRGVHPKLRLALQGLNPAHFLKYCDDMVAFLKQGYICHMQLPIQSGSDRMLRLMKRPYAAADIEMIFGLLNEVGFAEFETHIIFGFPGETDDDVEHTMQFILRHRPRYVLASGYMESAGMPSARLPGKVDSGTIQRRLKSAGMRMRNAQILCNTDDCELSTARFRRMNRV